MADKEQTDKANLEKTGNASNASSTTSGDNAAQVKAAEVKAASAPGKDDDALVKAKTAEEEERILAERTEAQNRAALGKAPASAEFTAPDGSVMHAGEEHVVGDPTKSKDAMLAQHEQVDRENEERNARNEEPFNRMMREEEEMRARAAEAAKELPPPTGKQRDVNTPNYLPDGTAVWNTGA